MQRIFGIILTLAISTLVIAAPAKAAEVFNPCSDPSVTNSELCANSKAGTKLFGAGGIWNRILNTITYLIGGISVLMIIIGAVRYTLSAGEQAQITAAKNTILYAIVALVIAVMANAIVNFVLTNI